MKETKRALLRIFFVVEMVICTLFYLFGTHGVQALQRMAQKNAALAQDVQALRTTVARIELDIELWQANDFYKEKKAREQLQMADAHDIIYVRQASPCRRVSQ